MKRTKIPTLLLQGDMWIKRMTPMSSLHEQIEEFINNVVARPKSSRKKHIALGSSTRQWGKDMVFSEGILEIWIMNWLKDDRIVKRGVG